MQPSTNSTRACVGKSFAAAAPGNRTNSAMQNPRNIPRCYAFATCVAAFSGCSRNKRAMMKQQETFRSAWQALLLIALLIGLEWLVVIVAVGTGMLSGVRAL